MHVGGEVMGDVTRMVNERRIAGEVFSDRVKFVVEMSGDAADPHSTTFVYPDRVVARRIMENLGIPRRVYDTLSSVIELETISYRKVVTFSKVFAWISQVFLDRFHRQLPARMGDADRVCCALMLSLQAVFSVNPATAMEAMREQFEAVEEDVVYWTLDNISSLVFEDVLDDMPEELDR